MTQIAGLTKFDESREKVRKEIREGFFDADRNFIMDETDFRKWIADRAVDELKLVVQLSGILNECAHVLPPDLVPTLARQMADESKHYTILGGLVPESLRPYLEERIAAVPTDLAEDDHWQQMLTAAKDGNPYSALIDINIVHEGYSAAAIEELTDVPFEDVREAYREIGADEERHYESGQDLLLWLTGVGGDKGAAEVIEKAHERADGGTSMAWGWP